MVTVTYGHSSEEKKFKEKSLLTAKKKKTRNELLSKYCFSEKIGKKENYSHNP